MTTTVPEKFLETCVRCGILTDNPAAVCPDCMQLRNVKPIDATDAACREYGAFVTATEIAVEQARAESFTDRGDTRASYEAAAPMIDWLCAECPIRMECYRWAVEDRYTGIAGGSIFRGGRAIIRRNHRDKV